MATDHESLIPNGIADQAIAAAEQESVVLALGNVIRMQGSSWAQISELVGNASAKVLADTYTHVLMDEREVDYASVIGERLGTPAESVLA